jgi:hypothetical protein
MACGFTSDPAAHHSVVHTTFRELCGTVDDAKGCSEAHCSELILRSRTAAQYSYTIRMNTDHLGPDTQYLHGVMTLWNSKASVCGHGGKVFAPHSMTTHKA